MTTVLSVSGLVGGDKEAFFGAGGNVLGSLKKQQDAEMARPPHNSDLFCADATPTRLGRASRRKVSTTI